MKRIYRIKDSFFSRQFATAKISIKSVRDFYRYRDNKSLKETLKGTFQGNIEEIVEELDLMKGSLMKGGQMLSLFGGAFLPEELKKILNKLENQSSFLDWDQIKKQIPKNWLVELSIEKDPMAAASLGQVHRFILDDRIYCMKIQYRGVRKAINNDIRTLKFMLKLFNFIPSEMDLNPMFLEIKEMLLMETDYQKEALNTKEFKRVLAPYEHFVVPAVLEKYSNDKILTTEFISGESLHNLDQLNLIQDQRNFLGKEFMRLFLMELFVFERVQTDAHFGNYLIITEPELKWGLIDFGATKEASKPFILNYQKLILALRDNNKEDFMETIFQMGYLSVQKESDLDLFWEYAEVIGSAFIDEDFDWGNNNMADKVFEYIPQLIKSLSLGNPPVETIFLDKKLGGVFFILQKLKAKFNLNELLDEVLLMKRGDEI